MKYIGEKMEIVDWKTAGDFFFTEIGSKQKW